MKLIWNHAYILMILTALAWSGNTITGKGLSDLVPPIGLAFWRWIIAIPILMLMSWPHLRKDLPLLKENWLIVLILSILSITTYNTIIYYGLHTTTAINALLINTARPSVIVLLSILIFHKGITLKQSIGFILATIGTVLIVIRGDLDRLFLLNFYSGDLWILLAMCCWALFTVLLEKRPKIHATTFLFVTVTLGAAILLPFYLWEAFFIKPTPFRIETVGSVMYLSIIATIAAFLFYNRAVEIAGANKAGQVSYMLPIFGVSLAIIILGEKFQLYHMIGFPLILCGVYFGSKGH